MDALVMAGGQGDRMKLPIEKPLIEINGIKLVEYVTNALDCSTAIENIHVAVSHNGTETRKWLLRCSHKMNINVINTAGCGFVPDMVDAVVAADINGPVLIIMADLPLVTAELIDEILNIYQKVPQPALSVYNHLSVYLRYNLHPLNIFEKNGESIVPLGINILDSDYIKIEQEDYNYILDDQKPVINVNTIEDLEICNRIMINVD